ncbi:hypothetical protein IEZ25_20675 [Nocardioides hwasunensis]|uniref:Carbohydrate kinase family protein n=1 Tax=Nocardioides hwasunensis TaxID=397258 RepID=A0ABR8MP17_9ACTN|nr:hypothetical protein [Nocardioides hwasunensis]
MVLDLGDAHVVAVDSAYDVHEVNRGRDVVVNASYSGVLPARFLADKAPAGSIGLDCGIGPQGASIAGLWYLEARDLPAATVDVSGVVLGDGVDVWTHGRISFLNQPARDLGVREGQAVEEAARAMLSGAVVAPSSASEVTNRRTMIEHPSGRAVVCTDSIAFGLPEDRATNVLVTAGHTGRSAVPYLEKFMPHAFICSDGGMGRERSGVAALPVLGAQNVPGAAVDARTARMGDALSSWDTGVISAVNDLAREAGVTEGMSCREAAQLLVSWSNESREEEPHHG